MKGLIDASGDECQGCTGDFCTCLCELHLAQHDSVALTKLLLNRPAPSERLKTAAERHAWMFDDVISGLDDEEDF